MYKIPKFRKSTLKQNESVEGETIEQELHRFINNGEPTADTNVKLHYTERKEGVIDAYNIRTDKWEIAVEASERISNSIDERRKQKDQPKTEDLEQGDIGKPEPV